ncbi:ECs_2282 family putative zinc-binding protein [Methylocystis sp.]|uniref:ECs_2282 family putative zinc-binding protein n=1 Tax=Methylocystis sp. TaxID=1911079 RepID=UPI003DA4E5DC
MSDDKISVEFNCKKCGGTVISLPDDPTDDSIATCQSCGVEFGRWGDIKAQATKVASDHLMGVTETRSKARRDGPSNRIAVTRIFAPAIETRLRPWPGYGLLLPLCTRPLLAGRSFLFAGFGAALCIGPLSAAA